MKSGWKTSEFWLTIVSVSLAGFLNSGLLPDAHPAIKVAGIVAAALTALGYSVSRGLIKRPPGAALALIAALSISLSACASLPQIDPQLAAQQSLAEVSKIIESKFGEKCKQIANDCGKAGDTNCIKWQECAALRRASLEAMKLARHALLELN